MKRQTAGRPKVILGSDRQPVRLPLDATAADLLDMFGPGAYRLDAIDEVGQLLDYVTTWTVGPEAAGAPGAAADHDPAPVAPMRAGASTAPVSDLRFALEAVTQLARTNGEALRTLADAQADWIKGLANAKAIPRNGFARAEPPPPIYLPPPMPLPSPIETSANDDDDDDGSNLDEEVNDTEEADAARADPVNTALGHIAAITKNVAPIARAFTRRGEPAPRNAAPPPSLPAAPSSTTSAVHFAVVLDRLTPRARALICRVLAKAGADPELEAWLDAVLSLPPEDAAAKLEAMARQSREPRPPADEVEAKAAAAPSPAATTASIDHSAEDAAKAQAVFALLTPMEQMQTMALLQSAPPEELEAIKATLRPLATADALAWLRARLEAEAAAEEDDDGGEDDGEE